MRLTQARRWSFRLGLAAVAGAFLLPQLWLASVSLKDTAGCLEFLPDGCPPMRLANYAFVLTHTQIPWYSVEQRCSRRSPPP